MDKEIIDKLEIRARHIGLRFAKALSPSPWHEYKGTPLTHEVKKKGSVTFYFKPGAIVEFNGVTPVEVTKEILHQPRLLNKKTNDVSSTEIVNASDNISVERGYDLTISETKTFNEHIGTAVETTLTQKFGYSLPAGASGETSISLSVSASYDKEWGGSNTVSRSAVTAVEVPPLTKATVTSITSKSNFEQRTEYWCDLDHSIYIIFGKRNIGFSSMSKLKELASGKAANDVTWGKDFRNNPRPKSDLDLIFAPLEVYADTTIYFSNATSGDVKITSQPYK